MPRSLPLLLLLAAGCPPGAEADKPDDTAAAGAEAVDILLVLDASSSMQQDAWAMAGAVDAFFADLEAGGVSDWRVAITTLSVYYDNGLTTGIDPGEAGTLVGGAFFDDPEDVREAILCSTVCWDTIASDPGYTCGDPVPARVSPEYLDCTCGVDDWLGHCGSGQEEGLEATYLALCRASASPPADCFLDTLDTSDTSSNPTFDNRIEVVIMSDEGDGSRRLDVGDTDASAYLALLDAVAPDLTLSLLGPRYIDSDESCLSGAQAWGVERYQSAVDATGGVYSPLLDAACDSIAAETLLGEIAAGIAE